MILSRTFSPGSFHAVMSGFVLLSRSGAMIVAEGSKPLRFTDRYFSRLVYPTRVPGQTLLFVFSSEQHEAYEAIASSIVTDIAAFKERIA